MHGVIDRFEEDYALVEVDGKITTIPRRLLPADSREGSAVVFSRGTWLIDKKWTEQLKKENQRLIDELWK